MHTPALPAESFFPDNPDDAHNLVDLLVHDEDMQRSFVQAAGDLKYINSKLRSLEDNHPAREALDALVVKSMPEADPELWTFDYNNLVGWLSTEYIDARRALGNLNADIAGMKPDMLGAAAFFFVGLGASAAGLRPVGAGLSLGSGLVAGHALAEAGLVSGVRATNARIAEFRAAADQLHGVREEFQAKWGELVEEGGAPEDADQGV